MASAARRIGGLALSLLAGCAAPQPRPPSPNDPIVYVIERGWHTDIGLPVEEIAPPLSNLEQAYPGVGFLTFGFGERQFLLSRQVTLGGMLTALLPSHSALLMTALRATPEAAFGAEHVVRLHVSPAGLAAIETRLWRELQTAAAGVPRPIVDGPYPGSVFFAARGTYDAFNTCNTWTAEMLRDAGLPMPTAGVMFVGQVMGMARWLAARQALAGDG